MTGSRHFVDNAQTVVKVSGRVRVAKNINFINIDKYVVMSTGLLLFSDSDRDD